MNNQNRQDAETEGDEQVQIIDLNPGGSARRKQAEAVIAVLHTCAATPVRRYMLLGFLICVLCGAVFLQISQPVPAQPAPASPNSLDASNNFLNALSVQNQVYIQTNDGTVTNYQAESGKVLWSKQLPGQAFLLSAGQTLDCYVTTANNQGLLELLDSSNGRLIWSYNLPAPGPVPLLQSGDTVYAGTSAGEIYAFQTSNGHLRWIYQYRRGNVDFSPPALNLTLSVQGNVAEIDMLDGSVHLLRADTGQEIQVFPANSSASGSPFLPVDQQLIYAFQNFDRSISSSSKGEIQVFRVGSDKPLWQLQVPIGNWAPIEANGVIVVSNRDGSVTALRGSDGHTLWTYSAGQIFSAPLEENGVLYATLQDSSFVGLRASDGLRLWHTQIPGYESFGDIQPFDNGILFLDQLINRGDVQGYAIYALRASDGHILWTAFDPPGTLTLQAGTLYILQFNGTIDAWREDDGQHLWRYDSTIPPASLDANPDLVFLLDMRDDIIVLRIDDGKVLWRYHAPT